MELQAVTGSLYLVNGAVQELPAVPGVLALSPPPRAVRGRSRDSLFVHLTISGPEEETAVLSDRLLTRFSETYYESPGSVTAALRKAIIQLNQQLLRLNLRGGPDREGAISTAVLRGNELYLAQAGEALAHIGHSFGVEKLPAATGRVTPLGRTAGLDIRYGHYWLESGDMLLLADPRLGHLAPQTLTPALVESDVDHGLAMLLQLVGGDTARLLLVEFTEEPPIDLPELAAAPPASSQRLPLPTRPPKRSTAVTREDGRATAVPARSLEIPEELADEPDRGLLAGLPSIRRPTVELGGAEAGARRATARAALGLSRAADGLADVLTELRPPPRVQTPEERGERAMAAFISVVIPIVLAVVFGSVYLQRGQVNLFSETKQLMSQNLGLGQQAADEQTALTYYNEVVRLATVADSIRPGDREVNRLRQEAVQRVDRINDVTRLRATALHVYPSGSLITSVVLGDELNGDIYTLDATASRVYRHDTDESYVQLIGAEPQIVLERGQAIGNHVIGELIDLMWRPRGSQVSRNGLAALDRRGALISYHPSFNETRAALIGLASDWWVTPRSITTFNERLYVLDTGAAMLWRYLPEGDGFLTDEAQRAVEFTDPAPLNEAIDVDIYSEDGSVLLLFGDGRLRQYARGRVSWTESDLAKNGLAIPLESGIAAKIVGTGLNSSIFVADPANGRIVQFSLRGSYLAEYKATDENGHELFARLKDFAIAEAPLRIFVAADNVLYAATQD